MMPQRKGKKLIIYFFLLLTLASINNIKFPNIGFDYINKINVSGLDNINNLIILKQLENLNLKNIFFLNKKEIQNIINSNTLVETYYVIRKYPDTIDIKILKTKFLAKINKNRETFLVGSNGRLSKINSSQYDLPYIFGKPKINEFLNFKKTIDQSKISYSDIEKIYFFQSKRWDIKLKNSVLIKLSKNYTIDSLEEVFQFLNDINFKDVKIIDARIKNQIIIND